MSLNIENLFYKEENIGLNIRVTKRQFVWGFDLDGIPYHIKLEDSRLSHKKRLFKNGDLIFKSTVKNDFCQDFDLGGHHGNIIQYADKMELRIDNQSFIHIYNLQKNKELFKADNGPTSTIKIDNNYRTIDNQLENNLDDIYKAKENKIPKLFNFKIKKNSGNKKNGFNSKFKFGGEENSFSSTNYKPNKLNNNLKKDLLDFQEQNDNNNGASFSNYKYNDTNTVINQKKRGNENYNK